MSASCRAIDSATLQQLDAGVKGRLGTRLSAAGPRTRAGRRDVIDDRGDRVLEVVVHVSSRTDRVPQEVLELSSSSVHSCARTWVSTRVDGDGVRLRSIAAAGPSSAGFRRC
jgi:hypothetical protein